MSPSRIANVRSEAPFDLAEALRDPALRALELQNFGAFLGQHGETEQGRQMIEESLQLCIELSNLYRIGKSHEFLAWLDRDQENIEGAITHYHESLYYFELVQAPAAAEVRADLQRLGAG